MLKSNALEKSAITRYVVTKLGGKPQLHYEKLYFARGDMEKVSSNSNLIGLMVVPVAINGDPNSLTDCFYY